MTEMASAVSREDLFKGRQFDQEIIVLCVRWYLRYKLSARDLVEMMAERGVVLAHTTILRWVQRYVPEFEKRWNQYARPVGDSWRCDETFHEMPGPCQAVFSCAVTNLARLRRSLSSLVASYSFSLLRLSG
jgi:transposase-like protein